MSTSIDWTELIKDKKGVITKDDQSCGNIIGEDEENIVIEDGAISQHFYRIPKSSVGGYNGAELTLNMQYNELATYEDKGRDTVEFEHDDQDSDKGTLESITDSIKNKVKSVKEKTVDKAMDATTQEESKNEVGHADNVQYETVEGIKEQDQRETMTNELETGKKQRNEINRNIDTGKQSDESSTNVESSFTCETCDTKFTSRQELKEHSAAEH
ncbi:MAG: hypothetical protein ACM3VV_06140 [Deltaproteobacteria bacterium]|jgi:hypothetical protein